jgi:hypothetical protein
MATVSFFPASTELTYEFRWKESQASGLVLYEQCGLSMRSSELGIELPLPNLLLPRIRPQLGSIIREVC